MIGTYQYKNRKLNERIEREKRKSKDEFDITCESDVDDPLLLFGTNKETS